MHFPVFHNCPFAGTSTQVPKPRVHSPVFKIALSQVPKARYLSRPCISLYLRISGCYVPHPRGISVQKTAAGSARSQVPIPRYLSPAYISPNSRIARFQGPIPRYRGPDLISLYSRIARSQVPNPRYLSPECISRYSGIARSRVPKPRYLSPAHIFLFSRISGC